MHVWHILCGISKVPFKIPPKISYPYIERCLFHSHGENLSVFRFKSISDFEMPTPHTVVHEIWPLVWLTFSMKYMDEKQTNYAKFNSL